MVNIAMYSLDMSKFKLYQFAHSMIELLAFSDQKGAIQI